MGCPTNAKQSMLVTTIPTALDRGATCWCRPGPRAWNWPMGACRPAVRAGGRQRHVLPVPVRASRARTSCIAGGAINSPALLMRSKLPDPAWPAGAAHLPAPGGAVTAVFEERIDGWQGAPQTMYTDHFLTRAHRRPHRLQARSAAAAPGDRPLTMAGFGDNLEKAMKAFPTRRRCWRCCATASTPSRRWPGQGCCRQHGVLDYPSRPS
jgi:hypothetical protein